MTRAKLKSMQNITVRQGQSLLDITTQKNGSLSILWDVARLNGKGITDLLTPGEGVKLELTSPDKPDVVAYLVQNEIELGTANEVEPLPEDGLGDAYLEYPEPSITLE